MPRLWTAPCYPLGVRSDYGFTLFELLVVMALITILTAVAIPTLSGSTERNSVWTASELIGSQIRQARLKAISRNTRFRIRFDCPAVGQFRVLQVTGDATIDDATDRCSSSQEFDSGIYVMPANVTYGDDPPLLEVNARGTFISDSGIPTTITVTYNGATTTSRSLTMSATGQIAFEAY
jgi:prepilin-type N-terminal cleavage/methylation domain-containing protein